LLAAASLVATSIQLLAPSPAFAIVTPTGCSRTGDKTVCEYRARRVDQIPNGVQTFVVPDGVAYLDLTLDGAGGGTGGRALDAIPTSGGIGGAGREVSGTLRVRPGDVVRVQIGEYGGKADRGMPLDDDTCTQDKPFYIGRGGDSTPGYGGAGAAGYGGGYGGKGAICAGGGGGGGGAASVLSLNAPLSQPTVVAGGGGGGGGEGRVDGETGGAGGPNNITGLAGAPGAGISGGAGGRPSGGSPRGADSADGAGQGGGGGGGGGYPASGNGGQGGDHSGGAGGGGAAGDSYDGGPANVAGGPGTHLLFPSMTTSPNGAGADGLLTIRYATPTVQFLVDALPSTTYGAELTYSAAVQSASGVSVPTGTLTVSAAGTVLCQARLGKDPDHDAQSLGACTSAKTPPGDSTVTLSYSGDDAFLPGQRALAVHVDPAPTRTKAYASASVVKVGQRVVYAAAVRNLQGRPEVSGSVTFTTETGVTLCSAQVIALGAACTTTATPVGAHRVTATFKPGGPTSNGYYYSAPSSGSVAITVK
jgi:hypothetical protein